MVEDRKRQQENHVRKDWMRWDYSAYIREGSKRIFLCLYTWWERVKKVDAESSQWCYMSGKVVMGPKQKIKHSILIWEKKKKIKHWIRSSKQVLKCLSLEIFIFWKTMFLYNLLMLELSIPAGLQPMLRTYASPVLEELQMMRSDNGDAP